MTNNVFTHSIDATEVDDQFLKKYGRFMVGKLSQMFGMAPENFQNDQRYEPIIDGDERYYYFVDQSGKRYCVLVTCQNDTPIGYKASEL
ncbi:MAG: hypothetical protein WC873_02840 [Candidatus Gracilibacteria bacterium]